ncbi:MAG TPA: TetR/AcrR family transcriptional regulator [Acidimicrobiales bacterium]
MATPRRMGSESSETRALLLDVTERLMREEGYAAVSSRRVASEANVTGGLVHYYFRTLDDLFLAVFRRRAEQELARLARALRSPQPLRALWERSVDPAGAGLIMEFVALSNHRKQIRSEIRRYAERHRAMQVEALASRFGAYGIDPDKVPPAALLVLLTGLSQVLVLEQAIGMTAGHAESRELVERVLRRLEGEPPTDDEAGQTDQADEDGTDGEDGDPGG